MKQFIAVVITILLSTLAHSTPTTFQFQPTVGKIKFETKGFPSLIKINGEGPGVSGKMEVKDGKLFGELEFELATLKTGIDLRDSHMKDNYLEVKKFPKAVLSVKGLPVPEGFSGDIAFEAEMKLHGKVKPVSVEATLSKGASSIKMKGNIPITLSDFAIAIPSYKGITVAKSVKISFESEAKY